MKLREVCEIECVRQFYYKITVHHNKSLNVHEPPQVSLAILQKPANYAYPEPD
jgi:hypothetical protein